jgi:hypothetical protein
MVSHFARRAQFWIPFVALSIGTLAAAQGFLPNASKNIAGVGGLTGCSGVTDPIDCSNVYSECAGSYVACIFAKSSNECSKTGHFPCANSSRCNNAESFKSCP